MTETIEGTRLLWAIRAERDLLRAMVTWPEGANGVLAIGAYEAMVRRLHKWSEADAAALDAPALTVERQTVLDWALDYLDANDEPCRFDHHGGCQTHGYLDLGPGEACPQGEAQRAARALGEGAGEGVDR